MVEASSLPEGTVRVPPETARNFIAAAFREAGVPEDHARIVAEVLVSADLRGIRSHGFARLPLFLDRLERGHIRKRPDMKFQAFTPATGLLDADNGLGIVAAHRAMEEALRMAEESGAGFVTVRRSSHFGYAGYWSRVAAERGCIGLSMSNGPPRVAPTFGADPILGTTPLSAAIPGGPGGHTFHLDMASAAVAVGKVETVLREGRTVPKGWVPESFGPPRLNQRGSLALEVPLLPLGGEGPEGGGHKGYGLSLLVELLCGALSGVRLRDRLPGDSKKDEPSTGHFVGAIRADGFGDPAGLHGRMAETFDIIRNSGKAPGRERIFIPGEPELLAEEENRRLGIPLTPAVAEHVRRIDQRMKLGFGI